MSLPRLLMSVNESVSDETKFTRESHAMRYSSCAKTSRFRSADSVYC
jgi:hypothetical protein